jgi:hypothetical protein
LGSGLSWTRASLALVVVVAPVALDVTRASGSGEGALDALIVIGGGVVLALTSPWGWVRRLLTACFLLDSALALIGVLAAGWLIAVANLAPYGYAMWVLALAVGRLVLVQRLGLGWWAALRVAGPRLVRRSDAYARRRLHPRGYDPVEGEYLPPQ